MALASTATTLIDQCTLFRRHIENVPCNNALVRRLHHNDLITLGDRVEFVFSTSQPGRNVNTVCFFHIRVYSKSLTTQNRRRRSAGAHRRTDDEFTPTDNANAALTFTHKRRVGQCGSSASSISSIDHQPTSAAAQPTVDTHLLRQLVNRVSALEQRLSSAGS